MATTDYLRQAGVEAERSDAATQAAWDALNQYLDTLDETTRQTALRGLKSRQTMGGLPGGLGGVTVGLSANDLGQILQTLRAANAPSPDASPKPGATQGAAGSSTPSGTTAAPTNTIQSLQDYGSGTMQFYGAARDLTQPGATGSAPLDRLAAWAGVTAQQLQSEYAAYRQQTAQTSDLRPGFRDAADAQPLTLEQYAYTKANALQGLWRPLIDAMDQRWTKTYGTPMPGDLRAQIVQQLNALDTNSRNTLMQQEMAYVGAMQNAQNQGQAFDPTGASGQTLLGYLPGSVTTSVDTYANANFGTLQAQTEIAAEQKSRQQNYIDWMGQHNITPTPEMLSTLLKLPASASSTNPAPGTDMAYLLNLPSNVPGLSWGQHDQAYSTLSPLWTQYFGIGRKPSSQELLWSVGKSQDEIMNHVMNSPSNVPGVTVGRYQDLSSFLGDMQKQLPVHQYDDFVQELDGHLKSPAGAKP